MMKLIRNLALSTAVFALPAALVAQSPCPSAPVGDHGKSVDGKPLASPAATAETKLNGKSIAITYNSPSMRCRKIFGGVVPYGKVWRTGANPATTLTTEGNIMIGTLNVPRGTYTLYTLPAAAGTPWMLIVNKQTGQWGTVYTESMDLGRVPMKEKMLDKPQEVMSITFEDNKEGMKMLHIRWENTDERVMIMAM